MPNSSATYEKLNLTENADIEDHQGQVRSRPSSNRHLSIATCFFAFTTALFGAQSLYLWSRPPPAPSCTQQNDAGYSTEWGPALESIKLAQTTFTSPLRYNTSSKQLYREFDPAQAQYIGEPSLELDAAWNRLLEGQFLVLSDNEAADLDDPVLVNGHWTGEVEVMHSLHCLNTLRKALSPEYYGPAHSAHLEHCFEQVRQSLQCAGDLTPVVLRPLGESGREVVVGTPMAHTCRSWDLLRKWYTQRGKEHGTVG
ncbi:hypothetical protein BDW74DRAFT_172832 [Aspergillus multicolor]|uniref:oxidase ustYa family protein n=1 Tax=Aspergillus multicolor TaxID=41759 RepID=UPI003CCD8FCB